MMDITQVKFSLVILELIKCNGTSGERTEEGDDDARCVETGLDQGRHHHESAQLHPEPGLTMSSILNILRIRLSVSEARWYYLSC